jgi:HPt (histidine-containing phosphotransfer) domain-containing protein
VESRVLEYTIRKFLPESLVTVVNDDTKNVIPQKTRAAFEILLRKYDVSLEMALKHLSGDILQFARVCEYFVNSTQQNIRTLNSYMDAGDYENATILVHSVKGNAGNVGGDDLYYSARRLEKRLKDKDSEYAVSALPLFIMKWNRVENGLKEFLKEFNKIKPDIIKDKDDAGKSMSEAELWDALLEAVRMGNQSPALKYVDELVRQKGNSKEMEEIKESIRNIEFDKAEDLISNIKNKYS